MGLRIAVWYNLPSGGSKRALYYHVKGLKERGHHLEAWRPEFEDAGAANFNPLSTLIQEHEVPYHYPNQSRLLARIAPAANWLKTKREQMVAHSKECGSQINRGSWDIVLGNTCLLYHSPFIARYVDAPTTLYLNEPYRPYFEALPVLPWVALSEDQLQDKSLRGMKVRLSDAINCQAHRVKLRDEVNNAHSFGQVLVNSVFSRETILRAYGLQPKVCYLGIDTENFKDLGLARERFVIGLGSITPPKNVKFLIEAIGSISKDRPPLVWVGNAANENYLQELKALAERLAVDFRPMEMVSDEVLVRLLNQASLMLYAPHLEPFGLAPLEANACGCPVLAVAEGGVKETVREGVNGSLCEPDAAEFGEKVASMLESPAHLIELGKSARNWVAEHWTLRGAVDRLEQALLKQVGRAG